MRMPISMLVTLSTMMPASEPNSTASSGTMMIVESCSATRGSLTRDETISAKLTAATAINGPATSTASSQVGPVM